MKRLISTPTQEILGASSFVLGQAHGHSLIRSGIESFLFDFDQTILCKHSAKERLSSAIVTQFLDHEFYRYFNDGGYLQGLFQSLTDYPNTMVGVISFGNPDVIRVFLSRLLKDDLDSYSKINIVTPISYGHEDKNHMIQACLGGCSESSTLYIEDDLAILNKAKASFSSMQTIHIAYRNGLTPDSIDRFLNKESSPTVSLQLEFLTDHSEQTQSAPSIRTLPALIFPTEIPTFTHIDTLPDVMMHPKTSSRDFSRDPATKLFRYTPVDCDGGNAYPMNDSRAALL
ncbi:hypothetical protein EBR57_01130 [bacterium]|nr:hypothetical protein [bacterium]